MKIAICDDIPIVSNYTERLILQYDPTIEVEVFNSSTNLEAKTLATEEFDVYILDIDIPTLDGVSLAKIIRNNYSNAIIIFLTSHREYMSEVFCLHTFDYLIKPLSKEKMFRVLENIMKYRGDSNEVFQFVWNKSKYAFPIADILFFEKIGRKVKLHGRSKEYEFYLSTSELLKVLPLDKFVQIHASYVVNSEFISCVRGDVVRITHNAQTMELPFGRKFKSMAKEKILNSFREKI